MTTEVLYPIAECLAGRVATAVRGGLCAQPKTLPPWLFYDDEGSRLFERITELPEYYLTRVERSILAECAAAIVDEAGNGSHLRIVELGAGSSAKTRLLLAAALARQASVVYEPVDVSTSALDEARPEIERELPGVLVRPLGMDYTRDLELSRRHDGERRLVLFIGSSIGNFERDEALGVLTRVAAQLEAGEGLLLGVDLRKDPATLLAAYDDADGVTETFNLNLLRRLNRELGADFDLSAFAHRAVWNDERSRIEMHLESLSEQSVAIPALSLDIQFTEGETIHTENSYKFAPGEAEGLISDAGFEHTSTWTDEDGRFAVILGSKC